LEFPDGRIFKTEFRNSGLRNVNIGCRKTGSEKPSPEKSVQEKL
jgi:hypothetical protein